MAREEDTRGIAIANSLARYGVQRWGRDFLRANDRGNLVFSSPGRPDVELQAMCETLHQRGIRTPFVVRFPEMIAGQMKSLHSAFVKAGAENEFTGGHIGMYPLKVNQRRSVVETVVANREEANYGLEAGSKPELLLAMAQAPLAGVPLVCNGFKDREFMRMAFHACELGHEVIVVIESLREVRRFLDVAEENKWQASPRLGMRAKLYSRGSGRWQSSGGERAKFGLNTGEMLEVVRQLEEAGRGELLTLLHFHIGSQITQIRRIKRAVREGARIYGELRRRCPELRYVDVGGGIGVDYDGSRTSYPSSANYTLQEYASTVVFEIKEVVDELGAPHPTIITESGRVIVATHAVMIADMREVQGEMLPLPEPSDDEHRLVTEMRYTLEHINTKNVEEYFHDAADFREECLQLFSKGYLSLRDRAAAEALFHRVRHKVERVIETLDTPPEEIVEYLQSGQHKYLVNFSIFQSLPDTWSIGQVFPVAPLSRHTERPNVWAEIVDITCDSDGAVKTFAHPDDNLRYLPLLRSEEGDDRGRYYLGFFMTGAYQDSLSNQHNLFSRAHEVIVRGPDDEAMLNGSEMIEFGELQLEVKYGLTNEDVLAEMDFDVESMNHLLRERHLTADTTLGKPWALGILQGYPYLVD